MAAELQTPDAIIWDLHDDSIVDSLLVAPARVTLSAEPAENKNGPTAALTVGYGVGPNLNEQYGGKIIDAMQVVAVDLDTGSCFARPPVNAHAVPLSAVLADAPSMLPTEGADGDLVSAARFGIDLAKVLSLPSKGGRFAVFIWLDRLVSNTVIVDIPSALPRQGKEATPLNAWPSPLVLSNDQPPSNVAVTILQVDGNPVVAGTLSGSAPGAVFVMDGWSRQVHCVSSHYSDRTYIATRLAEFLNTRPPSRYPSWSIVFDGQTAHQPLRIPAAAR